MKTTALMVGLLAILVFVGWRAIDTIIAVGGFQMPVGVWIAMIAAVLVALALGGVLMALAFYSDRQGYDEAPTVERDTEVHDQ
jgi:lysylphosphatidylglycerol synthetase-like protein (DUF2156 family)